MNTDTIVDLIRRICRSRDLDLAPLLIRRNEFTLRREFLELLIDTLFLDASFTLNKR